MPRNIANYCPGPSTRSLRALHKIAAVRNCSNVATRAKPRELCDARVAGVVSVRLPHHFSTFFCSSASSALSLNAFQSALESAGGSRRPDCPVCRYRPSLEQTPRDVRDARDARRYLRPLRFSCAPRRLHALATLEPARCAPLWCVSSNGSWGAARAMLATLALRAARALRAAPCACAVLAALAVLATLARVRSLASLANLSCVCGCEWCDRVSETGTGVISKPLFSSLSFPFLPPWRFCALRARLRRAVYFLFPAPMRNRRP